MSRACTGFCAICVCAYVCVYMHVCVRACAQPLGQVGGESRRVLTVCFASCQTPILMGIRHPAVAPRLLSLPTHHIVNLDSDQVRTVFREMYKVRAGLTPSSISFKIGSEPISIQPCFSEGFNLYPCKFINRVARPPISLIHCRLT